MDVQDAHLWKLARKRVAFKMHFAIYVLVNAFLWSVWYFTDRSGYPWPIWPTFGWGLGVALNYVGVYRSSGKDMIQREYDAIKKERGL
jgi:2TM domain